LKYNELGQLEVRIASENSRKVLGYGPEQLFELPSFLDVLTHNTRQEIIARIHQALTDVDGTEEETRLDIFPMAFTFPFEPEIRLWCAIHRAPGPEGLVICEFEEYSDSFFLKDLGAGTSLPVKQHPHIGVDVSPEELAKSTTSTSKPLPVLEIARQTENKQFSALDIFHSMNQAEKQIAACKSLESVYEVVVGIISELTGFHRVMLYRFDSQMNGCIEAELHDIQASPDVFRGKSAGSVPCRYLLTHAQVFISQLPIFRNKLTFCTKSIACDYFMIVTQRRLDW
jgi:light-regulated signal transduction histidine kinase (bacteriophytochrome)